MTRCRIFRHGLCIYCGYPNVDHKVICISHFCFPLCFPFFPTPSIDSLWVQILPEKILRCTQIHIFLRFEKNNGCLYASSFFEKNIHPFLIPCVLRIHCQGSKQPGRAGLFGTTCAGISSEPKSAPQLGKTCELRSEVAMRPSFLASRMVTFRIFPVEPCGRSMRIQIFRGISLKEYVENP